ncbi:MAG: DUF5682 family protein [Pseudomonadota bacterium]
MAAEAAYFGVRHHGPGSARRLLEALDELSPVEVLIEGPADLSPLLPMLASESMVPPVALLAYPADDPAQSVFWPFAVFSPEYQAALWAIRRDVPVRFIDLPVAWRMPERDEGPASGTEGDEGTDDAAALTAEEADAEAPRRSAIERDPIGTLAHAAGYEDGESWWRDVIEENPEPGPIFAAVADAMTALREDTPPPSGFEAAREAHMRLEIAKARKAADGTVAVVCGAWHVPALREKHAAKDDRALIKGAPKRKIAATWAPWTAPRLAFAGGYGAGVAAPGWCLHLWEVARERQVTRWVARIARALRGEGHIVSTASLIETERLSISLAAIRARPQPGFEELRDAAIACLCFGNPLLWDVVAHELLIGTQVGEIPDDVPMAPLLEDLQRQQRTARLKPEALERELSIDLRSDSGLFRSTLLHRLCALSVPWGSLTDAGRSRGTFRERWVLKWEPEYAVELVENLVYGATIERAAAGRVAARMREATTLGALADLVFSAMTAQLGDAAETGIGLLSERAGQTSDGAEMLSALPPLADVLRYGKARATDTAQLGALFGRIAVQGALALPYAARGLDEDAANTLRQIVQAADAALRLVDDHPDLQAQWRTALEKVMQDRQTSRSIAGLAARLLYEANHLSSEDAVAVLSRMLSPGVAVADAAAFFAGFLEGAAQRLLYDAALRDCIDAWIIGLDPDAFTEHLPLFRRVFASMDRTERKRLMDALLGGGADGTRATVTAPDAETRWPQHLEIIAKILRGEPHG